MANSDCVAIVLAGGKSSRLGRDKAREPLLGIPLLQHVVRRLEGVASQIVVVRARGQVLPAVSSATPIETVDDLFPEAGPLGGVYTGLSAMAAPAALAVACDMPLLQPGLLTAMVELLGGHDAVVPVADGRSQPLCAVYARSCLDVMRKRLDGGSLALTGALEALNVLRLTPEAWRRFDPRGLSFLNINTEEDIATAEVLLRAAGSDQPPALMRRCEVWLGSRQCGRPATHRTEHSGIYVCAVDAAVWGALYEEAEDGAE